MKIYGRTIAARPAQADPGDIFINLKDDKRYVYGADGQWSPQLPVTPVDMSDYVKKTDYATTEKAGVMKVGSGLDVTADGTVGATSIDMSDYVKKTDYATAETVGVMKVGTGLTADTTGTVSVAAGE